VGVDAAGKQITQYEAYVRLEAALGVHYGFPASHVRGHKETSVTGKIDPAPMDMNKFRTDVAAEMAAMEAPPVNELDVRHVVFFNCGRDKDNKKSSAPLDAAALQRALDLVGDTQAAFFGAEFNEGDDNNELALLAHIFKGWTLYAGHPGHRVREPILLSPDLPKARWGVTWVAGTAVPHWSPLRSILRVHLAGVDHSLVNWHNAAGPYTPAPRPERYREPLAKSWHLSQSAGETAKRQLHTKKRHVTQFSDLNRDDPKTLNGEVEVVSVQTDHGYAFPAPGFDSTWKAGKTAPGHIDSHRILTMHGTYRERG
jgi:hypothetical protein